MPGSGLTQPHLGPSCGTMKEAQTLSDSPFLSGNYAPVHDELTVTDLPVLGHLPAGLQGTFYRNGPNPQMPPTEPYHWFTGDGMVHAVKIGGNRAAYQNRWVRTPRFLAEHKAGRPLFAGFGQPLTDAANETDTGVANTHVLPHAGKLLALEEAHLPTRLDPRDLSTLGYDDFGGRLRGRFTAHPKRDPRTGQLVFFSYSATGPFSPAMSWGEIDADGQVTRMEVFETPYCSMVHDFAVTASHVVFPVLPLTGDLDRARSGRPPFAWDPAKRGFLGVMRRGRGSASLAWTEFEPCYAFHVMNAFDEGGEVVMDVVEYDEAPLFPRADGSAPPGSLPSRLSRWRVDPDGRSRVRREVLDGAPGEFPRIDERHAGLPYRHGFRIIQPGGPLGAEAVAHHDLERRSTGAFVTGVGERVSEAVFVPRGEGCPEGKGWLLTLLWRPRPGESSLLVLDAQDLEKGLVASVPLPRRVPFGFHGSWVAGSA